jgi:folate-binding Fe-S cluster repair protein YgfZ
VPFLQGLVTANLERLGIGEATHAALLTPQGKVLSAFFARRTADGMLLDCAPGEAGPLAQRLTLYKLRAAVAIEDRSEAMRSCVGDEGPEGARADPRLIAMGSRWLSEAASAEDDGAYDARRVSLGVPEFGYDYGPGEVFPMDVNLDALGTVDYRKGEVRKRSWCVAAEGDLAPGAEIVAGGSTLGTVTSARGHSGIALLRVDRVQAATERPSAGGVPVTLSPPAYLEGAGAGR